MTKWLASVLVLVILSPLVSRAQNESSAQHPDDAIPSPQLWASGGQKDADALTLLEKGATHPWAGFQAKGMLSYGSESSTTYPATLSVADDGHTRLDVQRPDGLVSSRLDGPRGELQIGNGAVQHIDARDAIRGLLIYPAALESSPRFSQFGIRMVGHAEVAGTSLVRIAVSRPLPSALKSPDVNAPVAVTDLYFSTDGKLVKSVDMMHVMRRPELSLYKRVVSYSDYQEVSGIAIPMRYDVTVNGQQSWTLTLSAVQPFQPDAASSYFAF